MFASISRGENDEVVVWLRMEGDGVMGDAMTTVAPGESLFGVQYETLVGVVGKTIDLKTLPGWRAINSG